jgi:transposase
MHTLSTKISQAEIDKLSYERFAYPDPMVQKRLHAVYLKIRLNYSNQMIGSICGLHYNTVGHWIKAYFEKGYEALLENNYGTNKSKMEHHSESILSSFRERPPYNVADAAERIDEMTGIRPCTIA